MQRLLYGLQLLIYTIMMVEATRLELMIFSTSSNSVSVCVYQFGELFGFVLIKSVFFIDELYGD